MDGEIQRTVAKACSNIHERSSGALLCAYVVGSRADDTHLPSSDLDLLLVTEHEGGIDPAVLREAAAEFPDLRVDFLIRSIGFYLKNGGPRLSTVGVHVYGPDVTERVPMEDFEAYFVRKVLGFVNYQRIIRGTEDVLRFPVSLPGRKRFGGYHRNGLLQEGGFREGFRTLINLITQGTTVIVGARSARAVYSKKASIEVYAALPDEPFVEFVTGAYELFNRQLRYELPTKPALVERADAFCRATPEFENHVLLAVRDQFADWPVLDAEPFNRRMLESFRVD